nr:MAG TPA: hypothetical protein [Caudoviricetes sp.]
MRKVFICCIREGRNGREERISTNSIGIIAAVNAAIRRIGSTRKRSKTDDPGHSGTAYANADGGNADDPGCHKRERRCGKRLGSQGQSGAAD